MKSPDRLCSLFFFLFSLFICFSVFRFRGGSISVPSYMLFPLLVGLFLLTLSIVLWVRSRSTSSSGFAGLFFKGEGLKIIYLSATFCLCVFILEPIGFVISILAFMTLLLKGIGGKSVGKSVVYGVLVSLSTYLFFTYLLGVRLPKGVLRFL